MFILEDGSQVNNLPHNYTGSWKVYNGNKFWYQHGKLHRLDGPAMEWADGCKAWYQKGKLHRLDGPAIEMDGGYKEWWINGKHVTKTTRILWIY
jgi:hypothetical protein